uniref:Uncharacterized protein TCIL3000_10_8300 n=1 Tax=Trypanosoma congolense (strain IL3000) TaxID=1068625 RepID=G0UXD7_TRYCI|nr:unnamed protein product [Trypanosoma congolense IL3000]
MNTDTLVLELACNLRWICSYLVRRLDPVVEQHYSYAMDCAKRVESALSHSFAAVKSITEMPSEALFMAQEGIAYLLVAEGVFGHCPPTMHPFLLRSASVCSTAFVTCCTSSDSSNSSQKQQSANAYQAQFLFVRWLVEECVLTNEELLDAMGDGSEAGLKEQNSDFGLHMAIAKSLSVGSSFALGLHLLLTRSLLLRHCSTLIAVEDVTSHLKFIGYVCKKEPENMESGLLLWLFSVMKKMYQGELLSDETYTAIMMLGSSLYEVVESGTVLAMALSFYKPHVLPLQNICSPGVICVSDEEEERQKRCYERWGKVLRLSQELGLHPTLYADEAGKYGPVVLHLHLLYFIGELFAMLATQAEDVESFCSYAINSQLCHSSAEPQRGCVARSPGKTFACASDSGCLDSVETCSLTINKTLQTHPTECGSSTHNTKESMDGSVVRGSYPSVHSRQQYCVMKASLLLSREGDSASIERNGGLRECRELPPLSPSETMMRVTATEESFPQGTFSHNRTLRAQSSITTPTYEGLVESARADETISGENKGMNTEECVAEMLSRWDSIQMNEGFLDSIVVHASSSFVNRPPSARLIGGTGENVFYHVDPAAAARQNAKENRNGKIRPLPLVVDTVSPLSSSGAESHNMVKVSGLCKSSENSFGIDIVGGRRGSRITSTEISPLTPDPPPEFEVPPAGVVCRECGSVDGPGDEAFLHSTRSSFTEKEERSSDCSELNIDDLLREANALCLPVYEADSRQKLLEALEHQRLLIQRLVDELLRVKENKPV